MNHCTVKDSFEFCQDILKQDSSLFMGLLDIFIYKYFFTKKQQYLFMISFWRGFIETKS